MVDADQRNIILRRCAQICLWLNVFLMLVKLSFGAFYASRALFADGIHSLLDVTADLFVLYAVKVASQPQDEKHPYGYSRYETLANIIVSILLAMASGGIIVDAWIGLGQTSSVMEFPVIVVSLVSILMNELSYRYVFKQGQLVRSDLLKTTAVHQRADAATSLVVLISASASILGMVWADIAGAIVIAILILYYALPSLVKGVQELLDRGFEQKDLVEIIDLMHSVDGVIDSHFLRTRSMASKGYLDVHVVVASKISVSEGHYIGDSVKNKLLTHPLINDVTVHIDAEDDQINGVLLPGRQAIIDWLHDQGCTEYERINIHYLNDQVELEIILTHKRAVHLSEVQWLSGYHVYVVCEEV